MYFLWGASLGCYTKKNKQGGHSVRFGKNLVLWFFTAVMFCAKKSNFFSSQHGCKLTNCYRSLSLIQMEKTNTTNKVGDKHPGILCSTWNYVHCSTHFAWQNPSSGASMSGTKLMWQFHVIFWCHCVTMVLSDWAT